MHRLLLALLLLPLTAFAQEAPPAPPAPLPPPSSVAASPPAAPPAPPAPPVVSAEVEAVRAAVEDYVLAFYEAAPERLERSLHPDLQKVGFYRAEDGTYRYTTMTYAQALDFAARWNHDGWLPAGTPREITVYEVNDRTAVARLVAHWGVDHLHLGNYDGVWKIINVIWQSPPASGQ